MAKFQTKKQRVETLENMTGKRSQWRDVWSRLLRNKLAVVGLIIVLLLILMAALADVIAPYGVNDQSIVDRMQFPSSEHWLGTDNYGRDLLTRIIYGGRTSLLVALLAVVIALITGGFLGATAGYFGGAYETIVMRVMDIIMAIPGFLMAVSVSSALGNGTWQTALAISISGIPSYCRIIRATVMTIRDQEYVEAAKATGAGHMRIIFSEIIPNAMAPIIVDTTLRFGANILMISSLSFIGLGVRPPTAEWGSIMTAGRDFIRDFYPIVTFPGVAIMLTLFGFNLLGDGLRDALDPKLKN